MHRTNSFGHQCHLILQQMTAIGKEDYVGMMMKVYKRFIKFHDYLHENIHRLQVIYKFFYGGLIQPIQVLQDFHENIGRRHNKRYFIWYTIARRGPVEAAGNV
mmetsp:Transcript_16324/g.29505  ORF Transcript_16324/g.29505 Transcript_16324/m.29505 type:complete len:103 (-) Transcript_16324:644-952(-)